MIRNRKPARVATLALAAVSLSTLGTTIVHRSFDDLCARADLILCGTVSRVSAATDPTTGAIHTYTTFEQIDWILGESTATTFTLRTLGGTAGGERLVVSGMPRFRLGKRYVLFVRGNGRVVCPLVGWHQGCFRLTDDDGLESTEGQRILAVEDGRIITRSLTATREDDRRPISRGDFFDQIRAGVDRTADRRAGATMR